MAKQKINSTPVKFKTAKSVGEQFHKLALTPGLSKEGRYETTIANGKELHAFLSAKGPSGVFPRNTIGHFLYSKGIMRIKEIYEYYSRRDIQQAIYEYAVGRKIAFLRLFKPQYENIINPEDIMPLVMCTLFERGSYWPSLHGTISRYTPKGKRMCDVVIELDYKSGWKQCFEMTRPVVDMLLDHGAIFRMKFSGHCSVHIIIPAEVLQIQGFQVDHSKFFRCLSDLVKRKIREPRYLDTSFHAQDHFLRLAYSLNENTGLVSLPFDVSDYSHFDPEQARPNNVKPLPGWWSFPKDAPIRMEDFIKYVMRGQVALSGEAAIQMPVAPSTRGLQVDQRMVHQVRLQKRQAAREFLPNEGFYDRMVRLGQDIIDLREFLLLEDWNTKTAMRAMRHLHHAGEEFSLSSMAKEFDVDESDLKMLWNWELNERAFRYYARDDIKQIIYALAEGRKIRVGNEDKLFFLQGPSDILPLIVYNHLMSDRVRTEYPAFYFTNSRYERTGEIPIACDLKIEFSTKTEEERVIEAAMPVISLLSGFEVIFFMFFDGVRGLNIMIPYQAFPAEAKLASIRHNNILIRLTPYLKHSMRTPGASCTLVRDPHAISLMPYSVNPNTGLACIPIQFSDLLSFTERDAWLGNVQVNNEWWDIPEDAPVATANFLKQIAPTYL